MNSFIDEVSSEILTPVSTPIDSFSCMNCYVSLIEIPTSDMFCSTVCRIFWISNIIRTVSDKLHDSEESFDCMVNLISDQRIISNVSDNNHGV